MYSCCLSLRSLCRCGAEVLDWAPLCHACDVWERLTDRRWPRWELGREDGEYLHLWDIFQCVSGLPRPLEGTHQDVESQVMAAREMRWADSVNESLARVIEAVGKAPDPDVAARLFGRV